VGKDALKIFPLSRSDIIKKKIDFRFLDAQEANLIKLLDIIWNLEYLKLLGVYRRQAKIYFRKFVINGK